MSKKEKISTKELIADKALEMFNKNGIEYVGVRELASLLNMRVSNITYYYPTKDDLVNQLSLNLNKLNSETVVADEQVTIESFFEMMRHVFKNHLKYACLFLSVVHIMKQNKVISKRYKQTQAERSDTLKKNIDTLTRFGYLKVHNEADREYIISSIAFTVRFWISESAIVFEHLSPEQQIDHYLSQIARTMAPFATAKGRRELEKFKV